MTAALYPGTFDPITRGHVDIAERAAALFEKVVVGVYDTPAKTLLFATDERVDLAKEALRHVSNIQVQTYRGLTVDFAAQLGAAAIVRGLRMVSDFETELQMAHQSRAMRPNVDYVCLMTSLEYSFLSATLMKEVARLGADVASLVPKNVARALEARFKSTPQPDDPPRFLNA